MTDEQRDCVSAVDQSIGLNRILQSKGGLSDSCFFAATRLMQESRLQKFILMHIGGSEICRFCHYRNTSNTGRPSPIEMHFSLNHQQACLIRFSWAVIQPQAEAHQNQQREIPFISISYFLPWIFSFQLNFLPGCTYVLERMDNGFAGSHRQPPKNSCFNDVL